MAPSSDRDVLLGRVLPHVEHGVINQVQRSILAFDWEQDNEYQQDDDDDSDSLDYELDPRGLRSVSTPCSRQSRTNSTSDISYAGFSGGLSPPRTQRLLGSAIFADFDQGVNETSLASCMADHLTIPSENKHATSTFARQVLMPFDLEPAQPPAAPATLQKSDSRASHSAGAPSSASSLRHQRRLSGVGSPVEPPPRSSSSRLNSEPQGLAAIANQDWEKPLPPVQEGSPRPWGLSSNNFVLRSDDSGEAGEVGLLDLGGSHAQQQHHQVSRRPSTAHAQSSTPPPIAHSRRMVIYDGFEEQEEDDDPLRGFGDRAPPPSSHQHQRPITVEHSSPASSRKPPVSMRSNPIRETRLDSMSSASSRGAPMPMPQPQHGAVGATTMMHDRTAPLAANYRDLRTPVLDHVQLYHDAQSKKPLFDPATDGRILRSATLKPRRILDDSSAMLYNNVPKTSGSVGASINSSSVFGGGNSEHLQVRSNPPRRRAFSDDEVSLRHSISGRTDVSLGSQSMPDFFSASIFQVVLHNPTTAYRLLKFSESRLCAENVEFLAKVDAYRATLNGLAEQMASIHKTYISPSAPNQINVDGALLKRAHRDMRSLVTTALPSLENVFAELQKQIETLVYQDVYPRFVRHQMALSASRALGGDRFQYQGLGDCFCLTNPK